MKTLSHLPRYSLSACLSVVMLAGCGGSQLGSASLLPGARTVTSNNARALTPIVCPAATLHCAPAVHTGIDPPDFMRANSCAVASQRACPRLTINQHRAQSDSARSTANQCNPTATARCIVAEKR